MNRPPGRPARTAAPPLPARSRSSPHNPLPGAALRLSETPPVPPPRPESSIGPGTRDIRPAPRPSSNDGDSSRPPRSLPVPPSIPGPSPPLSLPLLESLPAPPASPIRLTTPRPGQERSQNLYVDAPLKTGFQQAKTPSSLLLPQAAPRSGKTRLSATPTVIPGVDKSASSKRTLSSPLNFPAKGQPSELGSSGSGPPSMENFAASNDLDESIICRECGRCRCAACRATRKLPEKWVCGNKCHVSAETVVDTMSCMWLVKAFLYHCGKDAEESAVDDNEWYNPCPCPAEPSSDCCLRWTCAGVASLCLPCLCCYLPLKGGAKCVEAAFQRVTSNGCRCVVPTVSGSNADGRNCLPSTSGSDSEGGKVITTEPSLSLPSPSSSSAGSTWNSPGMSENRGLLA